jgi:hypothetical protein
MHRDLCHLCAFKCPTYEHVPDEKWQKLDSKTQKCTFVDYVESPNPHHHHKIICMMFLWNGFPYTTLPCSSYFTSKPNCCTHFLNVNFCHSNFAKLHAHILPWIDLKFWWNRKAMFIRIFQNFNSFNFTK